MTRPTQTDLERSASSSNVRPDAVKSGTNAPSISVGEIEALLRSARENAEAATSIEELGPGDVQYFRGESAMTGPNLEQVLPQGWFESRQLPDELLQHAEHQLAEAIAAPSDQTAGSRISAESRVTTATSMQPVIHPSQGTSANRGLSLEDLGNLDLDISIELGRTELLIEEVMKLREGSVVSLDKLAGDPVDIVANGRLVARGELLVIDGKFGVRLSEVL